MTTFLKNIPVHKSAFTLMEIMIVVVIVTLIAVAILPKFSRTHVRELERNAINNLRVIHAAQQIYRSKQEHGLYYPCLASFPDDVVDQFDVNAFLNINIIGHSRENETRSYGCNCRDDPGNPFCSVSIKDVPNWVDKYHINVYLNDPLEQDVNPCCVPNTESCPTVPDCPP